MIDFEKINHIGTCEECLECYKHFYIVKIVSVEHVICPSCFEKLCNLCEAYKLAGNKTTHEMRENRNVRDLFLVTRALLIFISKNYENFKIDFIIKGIDDILEIFTKRIEISEEVNSNE